MMHVTYSEKSLLVDDDVAEALMEYARVLAGGGGSDTVTLRAINSDGHTVDATFLLTPSTILMIETADSEVTPPSNARETIELRERIRVLSSPPHAVPEDESSGVPFDSGYL